MSLSDFDVQFIDRGYGKTGVRLLHVRREGQLHHIKEVEVATHLTLNDAIDYTRGDNSKIIATDSQKNTVYILAKQYGISTIEGFAQRLAEHFLTKYPQVVKAHVKVAEKPWRRIQKGGQEHVHAFIAGGDCVRFCEVKQEKHGVPSVSAGLQDMKVLKTTKSAFKNFVSDEFRVLPDADDRVFCTIVKAKWNYHTLKGLDFDQAWNAVKTAILDMFAGPPETGLYSESVQKTLYDAERLALGNVPQIEKIEMEMPNVHNFAFDMSKFPAFGVKENNEVFQPVDKPSGNIQAVLSRRVKAKL